MSTTGVVVALVGFQALTMNMFQADHALWIWMLLAVLGAPVGLLGGAIAHVAWSMSPRLTRWAGPIVGGVLGCVLYALVTLADQPDSSILDEPWFWIGLAGSAAVGPPWLAYCAVMERGRSPRFVALATGPWTTAVLLLMLGTLYGVSVVFGVSFE